VGYDKIAAMPKGLERRYGEDDLHYITCSCYERRPFLGSPQRRDVFLDIFEQVRRRYRFIVVGYVVMPEHFHMLVSEPQKVNLSVAMQVLKQRVSNKCLNRGRSKEKRELPPFWYPRSYDFNVFTEKKKIEKLRYMHRNPVKRGLVESPEQWKWSSYRYYLLGEEGLVKVTLE
jgi:putative transposase